MWFGQFSIGLYTDRGVARISIRGRQRSSAKGARIEAPKAQTGLECGEGCPLPHWDGVWGGGCAHTPENFWNFCIKMVSFRAFWVAISYRLAVFFTRIGSGIEIYYIGDRFSILEHWKDASLRSQSKCFRIYSLKIFEGGGLGAWPPVVPYLRPWSNLP